MASVNRLAAAAALLRPIARRPFSSESVERFRRARSEFFQNEKIRQNNLIGLLEKVEVRVRLPAAIERDDRVCFAVNKDVSTPNDCALAVSRAISDRAALALVNGQPWDMHRPLTDHCDLEYLFYTDPDPKFANKAYWRTCSFVLGYILETSFKESVRVVLHSWPAVDVRSGSFVYDVDLGEHADWQPSKEDYRMLSRVPIETLRSQRLPFECLNVDAERALKVFQNNRFKCEQIESIVNAHKSGGKVPLYRMGDHVDISRGPMVASTAQFGFYSITAFHPIETAHFGRLTRVQGVSVPFTQRINSWAWEVVCENSKALNPLPLPSRDRYAKAPESQAEEIN